MGQPFRELHFIDARGNCVPNANQEKPDRANLVSSTLKECVVKRKILGALIELREEAVENLTPLALVGSVNRQVRAAWNKRFTADTLCYTAQFIPPRVIRRWPKGDHVRPGSQQPIERRHQLSEPDGIVRQLSVVEQQEVGSVGRVFLRKILRKPVRNAPKRHRVRHRNHGREAVGQQRRRGVHRGGLPDARVSDYKRQQTTLLGVSLSTQFIEGPQVVFDSYDERSGIDVLIQNVLKPRRYANRHGTSSRELGLLAQ